MKKVLMTLCVAAIAFGSKAQDKKFGLGVGPVVSIPTGDFGTGSGVGIGAELQATYPLSSSIEGFAQTGYQSFSGKTISYSGGSFTAPTESLIPVLVGARYKQGAEGGFIAGLGIGYGSFSASGGTGSSGGFAYSPQVGYSISKFDFIANYTSVSVTGGNATFFGLKAFYKFL
jgi:hypothetical protein